MMLTMTATNKRSQISLHSPREPNLVNEPIQHYGEKYSSNARASADDPDGETPSPKKPSCDTRQGYKRQVKTVS